jgi:hypothetical protein
MTKRLGKRTRRDAHRNRSGSGLGFLEWYFIIVNEEIYNAKHRTNPAH